MKGRVLEEMELRRNGGGFRRMICGKITRNRQCHSSCCFHGIVIYFFWFSLLMLLLIVVFFYPRLEKDWIFMSEAMDFLFVTVGCREMFFLFVLSSLLFFFFWKEN